jgi:hypothetical protein
MAGLVVWLLAGALVGRMAWCYWLRRGCRLTQTDEQVRGRWQSAGALLGYLLGTAFGLALALRQPPHAQSFAPSSGEAGVLGALLGLGIGLVLGECAVAGRWIASWFSWGPARLPNAGRRWARGERRTSRLAPGEEVQPERRGVTGGTDG